MEGELIFLIIILLFLIVVQVFFEIDSKVGRLILALGIIFISLSAYCCLVEICRKSQERIVNVKTENVYDGDAILKLKGKWEDVNTFLLTDTITLYREKVIKIKENVNINP